MLFWQHLKETLGPLQESLAKGTGDAGEEEKATSVATSGGPSERAPAGGAVSSAGKYVPPSKRDGAKTGDAMPDRRRSKNFFHVNRVIRPFNLDKTFRFVVLLS
jgi:hypothetical protein